MSANPLKRKELLLGLLLAVLVGAVLRNLLGGASGGGAAGPGGAGRAAAVDLADLKIYPVDWASLTAPRPGYDPNGRNIFQYGTIPPPPPPVLSAAEQAAIKKAQEQAAEARRKAEEELRARQAAAQAAAAQARANQTTQQNAQANQPPPAPPKPQPPPIPYKFIGYFGPVDNKVAVLHDGADMLFVRRGETLPKGIKVLEIGYESIKFGFTDPQFKDESRTLPMSSSY